MIRALPVVVTERVGAAEIVQASGAGVVVGPGKKTSTAALADLLRSNQRLAAASAAGASYVRSRLTWERMGQLFEELYVNVIRQTRSRSWQSDHDGKMPR